uniref:PAS fold-3 domain-containing protein n=1 Tax=Globodera rostochiensis TaxID=31243 RepID=A0A914H724_GLORO
MHHLKQGAVQLADAESPTGYGQPSVAYGLNELRLCASMFMFRATPALQLIFVDNCFTELTKFLPDSLLNQSLYSFIHPADVNQLCESAITLIIVVLLQVQQTALRGGQALSAFFRLLNAEGGWHWVQCRLCTTITSRLPSLTQIVVGVCSIVRVARDRDQY